MDRQEIKYLINYLDTNLKHLNSLQYEFFASLKKQYQSTGFLTKRQVEGLYDMKEYIPSQEMTEAVYESESDKYQNLYSSFDSLTPFTI